ncbi:MAG: ribose 5-phosphate isomerase B [Acidobacteriota bacterium]|nr:ribose 5-phosphate isomerase B [Acidobacteriota bacterium]
MIRRIAIGSDHAGFEDKEKIKRQLDELGIEYQDVGTNSTESVDYPIYAQKVAEKVASGEAEQGILVCGSGNGMQIAANKICGVRAALAWNEETARLARQHNDANVLSVPARMISPEEVSKVIESYLKAEFEGGRHARRVAEISNLEKETDERKS